jgi:hypothetical protein
MVALAFRYSSLFTVLTLFLLLLYAWGEAAKFGEFLEVTGIILLLALASFAAGGIIGFLFGIPHVAQRNNNTTTTGGTSGAEDEFTHSTNLEQIADWLTKILVGVGLTQLPKIIQHFNKLCNAVGGAFDSAATKNHGAPLAGAILIVFAITGFLIVYLWTYLYLIRIQNALCIKQLVSSQLSQTANYDKKAIDLANTQMILPQNLPDIPKQDLVQAFARASGNIISTIFFNAVEVRKQNCNTPATKYRIDRTVPIWEALIALDTGGEHPEDYAELGMSLKDKQAPDYIAAITNFDKAIEKLAVHDCPGIKGMVYYNRAFCRIVTDARFNNKQASADNIRQTVLADLQEAAKEHYTTDSVDVNTVIATWKQMNGA